MKPNPVFSLLFMIFSLFILQDKALAEDIKLPAPVGDIYVQDFANVLTENEKAELIRMGRALENQTTAQVAVLTVDTIGEKTIAEFSNEAFRQYGIGSEAKDNGVLLVIAVNDRSIWIEVGYGLEGRIPDGKAGRILDEHAIPFLQNNQPNKAIIETYKVLANEVLSEYGQEGLSTTENGGSQTSGDEGLGIPSWLLIIIVIVVVVLDFKFFGGTLTYLLLSIISRGGGRGGGGSRGGGGGSSGGGGAGRGW